MPRKPLLLHERKCSFPKTQFEHIFQRNNAIFSFDTFWFIALIRTSFSSLSRISYIQLKLQTSSRRCLSGSSSCIIRSFSALILSSRRCCAAYNFKTTLLFNLRFFFSPTKKTRMLKDKIWLLTSCLWECDCFKRFSSSSRRFFSALAFAYKWKGKVFFYYHIIALKRTNSIEVFFQVTQIMTDKGNTRPIRTGQFFTLLNW